MHGTDALTGATGKSQDRRPREIKLHRLIAPAHIALDRKRRRKTSLGTCQIDIADCGMDTGLIVREVKYTIGDPHLIDAHFLGKTDFRQI